MMIFLRDFIRVQGRRVQGRRVQGSGEALTDLLTLIPL
jgi:hypothetical protein